MRTLVVLLKKEFRQFFRNSFMPKLSFMFPLMVMLVLPWATTLDANHIGVIVIDSDCSSVSKRMIQKIDYTKQLEFKGLTANYYDALDALDRGDVDVIVDIPEGFEKSVISGSGNYKKIKVDANGVNSVKGSAGVQYVSQVAMLAVREVLGEKGGAVGGAVDGSVGGSGVVGVGAVGVGGVGTDGAGAGGVGGVGGVGTAGFGAGGVGTARAAGSIGGSAVMVSGVASGVSGAMGLGADLITAQSRYNPTMNYRYFMIPALMIMILLMLCGFFPALNIVSEKEIGTIEQINVTPVGKLTFIFSKLIPYWIVGMVSFAIALIIARFVYGIEMAGSFWAILLGIALFALAMSGVGLFISNISSTMQQAMFVTFFIVLIFVLLSGLITPIESMPVGFQWLTYLMPPRFIIEIMRAVYLKGATISEIWPNYVFLAGYVIVTNLFAAITYKKQS